MILEICVIISLMNISLKPALSIVLPHVTEVVIDFMSCIDSLRLFSYTLGNQTNDL